MTFAAWIGRDQGKQSAEKNIKSTPLRHPQSYLLTEKLNAFYFDFMFESEKSFPVKNPKSWFLFFQMFEAIFWLSLTAKITMR